MNEGPGLRVQVHIISYYRHDVRVVHLEGCERNAPVGDAMGVVAGVVEPFEVRAEGGRVSEAELLAAVARVGVCGYEGDLFGRAVAPADKEVRIAKGVGIVVVLCSVTDAHTLYFLEAHLRLVD
eukprot:7710522-Pyramimonas_sp.AAC.1